MSLSYLDYSKEEYKKNPENHHKEYWKKLFNLDDIMDDKTIGIAAKYLDKCKKYIENNDLDSDEEIVLFPIVIRVIKCDKRWPHEDFNPAKIISVYKRMKAKSKQEYFCEIRDGKIDLEAEACLQTARHFSKNKNDKNWGLKP